MKRTQFCDNWKFGKAGQEMTPVTLPHDAMQYANRAADAPSGSGAAYYLGESYVYEKTFIAPLAWEAQTVFVEFEGVYPTAEVWLNGRRIGSESYGYNLFRVELTGLVYDEENTLRVEADNSQLPNSRWYSGAGIYRPVWLLSGNKEHILPDGVKITTLSYDPPRVQVDVETTAISGTVPEISVEIYDSDQIVTSGKANVTNQESAAVGSLILDIPDAKLWDDENPNLYECMVTLSAGGAVLDSSSVSFGIRMLKWSTEGLFVNGRSVLLKGGCIHHDNGIMGSRSYAESEFRRVRKLKEMGFNAIRSAHNPACPALLAACDRLGVYVMDELWDMWDKSKTEHDYAARFPEHYEADMKRIVAKDYNHPSVILYSIGNEVTEPAKPEGMEIARKLYSGMKEADSTRPVTAGINLTLLLMATMESDPFVSGAEGAVSASKEMNSTAYNEMVSMMGNRMTMAAATPQADEVSTPVLDLLDIAGYNYAVSRYAAEGKDHPNRVVVGSETYPYEIARTWPLVEKYPYVIGDFMWTSWDYLGEAGVGGWSYDAGDLGFGKSYPWLLADTGAMDILGNDNAEAGLAAVVWGARKTPYIGVCPVNHPGIVPSKAIWRGSNALPYWSYLGCDGNDADVEICTTGAKVELLINGKSAGCEDVKDCQAFFHVKYEPGELKAVAYNADGSVQSESCLQSADENTQIRITPESEGVRKGGVLYLDISLTGANGEIECNRDTFLTVQVEGGELLAFGSACPKTEENFLCGGHTTYYGRSLAAVRLQEEKLTVAVKGDNLRDAVCEIHTK